MKHFPLLLLVSLLSSFSVIGQKSIYASRESFINRGNAHNSRLIRQANGKFHLWRWGNGKADLNIYDKNLAFVATEKLRKGGMYNISFLQFKEFYYVLLSSFQKADLYLIKGDSCIKKNDVLKKLPLEAMRIVQVAQDNQQLYFIQHDHNDTSYAQPIHITSIDLHLQYFKTYHLNIAPKTYERKTLLAKTAGDELFLMLYSTMNESTPALLLTKLNIKTGKVITNTIQGSGKRFFPTYIEPFGNGFLLVGQSTQSNFFPWWRNTYTTDLLQLDSSLNIVNNYHTGLPDIEPDILPNKTILLAGFRSVINAKTGQVETQQVYDILDSNLHSIKTISRLVNNYCNYSGYVMSEKKEVIILYEERVSADRYAVHQFPLMDEAKEESDRVLELWGNNRYIFQNAVRTANNVLVMPYLRNYNRIGLAQIKVL